MKTLMRLGAIAIAALATTACHQPTAPIYEPDPPASVEFRPLPPLIEPLGLASGFAGVSGDALLFAGGANFPDGRPWDGATKVWHDGICVMKAPDAGWQWASTPLPQASAYGVSVTWNDAVVCVGGCDSEQHHAHAFLLRFVDGDITVEDLPPLPGPAAYLCGALVGSVLYVAGGTESPTSSTAYHTFWSLDLAAEGDELAWHTLDPWPGPERMLAVAAATDDAFYLMSGVRLVPGDGGAEREYLRDAYRYSPSAGWEPLPDLPFAAAAAPSPTMVLDDGSIVILGGDDGALAGRTTELRDDHPGFAGRIQIFDLASETWRLDGLYPRDLGVDPANRPYAGTWPPVTAPMSPWHGRWVIVSGEARPGVRTPKVMVVEPRAPEAERLETEG